MQIYKCEQAAAVATAHAYLCLHGPHTGPNYLLFVTALKKSSFLQEFIYLQYWLSLS